MTRSPLARIVMILSLAALLFLGAGCGKRTIQPALTGDVPTTTTTSTTVAP